MDGGDLGPGSKIYKPTLILCVGLPRSGKTTWANNRLYEFLPVAGTNMAGQHGTAIVCPDEIRKAIHGQRYIQEAEDYVWAVAHTMVKALFTAGHGEVILDSCGNTKKRRDPWFSKDWNTHFAVFTTSYEECRNRALKAKDDYILPIIDRMHASFEPLTMEELTVTGQDTRDLFIVDCKS